MQKLEERVSCGMKYSMSDLKKLRLSYFDLVGVVHSVLKTTRCRYVVRLTRLEELPIQLELRVGGFFKIKPDMISHYEVEPIFNVAEKYILDIVVFDEHIDIARNNLKSGDFVVLRNLHFAVGSGSDTITLHGANNNREMSNERGIYLIPDDFVDPENVFNSFRWSFDQQIQRRPALAPLNPVDAITAQINDENRNNDGTTVDELNKENDDSERLNTDEPGVSGKNIPDSNYESMPSQE